MFVLLYKIMNNFTSLVTCGHYSMNTKMCLCAGVILIEDEIQPAL